LNLLDILEQNVLGEMLITLVVSMLPVLELRGAIPLGVSLGLDIWPATLVSIVGNMIPVPFIILFIRRVFEFLRSKSPRLESLVSRLEKRAAGKWQKVYKYRFLGLAILVAIPLPGTGAWTGALIAGLMDMRMKNAIPAILVGVIIAAVLISGITFGFTAIFALH